MGLFELFIIAAGLSMDAFAVSICKGLSLKSFKIRHSFIIGLYFGGFQAAMPLLGYLLGASFKDIIAAFDHWIAFGLLVIIGINMIIESRKKEKGENPSLTIKVMIPLAVATSIDALAVGVSFAFLDVRIVPAIAFIGVITFALSALGVKIGNAFGAKYKSISELAGGIILMIMGTKILFEHLGII